MWGWIINAVRWAAAPLAGYFINDLGTGIARLLPENTRAKVVTEEGKFQWWYLTAVFVLIGGVVLFVLSKLMKGKKGRYMMAATAAGYYAFDLVTGGDGSGAVMATSLVTLTTGVGVVTSINTPFLPERISYAATTQLSAIKVSVQGDGVIFDSDSNGLTHVGVSRVLGQVTNNYIITLANGLIKGKNVLFEFTNSAAQTPTVYYDSDSTPSGIGADQALFLQMMKVPVLVGGNDYSDFATLSFPSIAATDSVTILYNDGTVQANMNRADLQYRLGYLQNVVNTPIYTIDNFDQRIKSVTLIAGSSQTGYMQRFAPSVSKAAIAGQPSAIG